MLKKKLKTIFYKICMMFWSFMNNKLHLSKDFLQKRYIFDKKSIEDIAKECGVSVQLIYRQLKKFGLKK